MFQRWGIGGAGHRCPRAPRTDGLHDIGYAGGTVLARRQRAGRSSHSIDGLNFFYHGADAPPTGRDWDAVDLADAAEGAVGGTGGALVITRPRT